MNEIESDLEEQKELAASRLQELEKLNVQYQNSLKQIEKLKADVGLLFNIFKEGKTQLNLTRALKLNIHQFYLKFSHVNVQNDIRL